MSKAIFRVELDPELIDRVHRYSKARGKEVSETVGELIEQLPVSATDTDSGLPPVARSVLASGMLPAEEPWEAALTPAVRSILGAGAGPADEEDYREYLVEKYGR